MSGAKIRLLGIDHGTKRIGLAYGDELGVAMPIPAATDADPAKRWKHLGDVLRERRITELVIGLPLNMDGTSGPKASEVEEFAKKLKGEFGLPVHFVDERLTSYEAESTIAPAKRRGLRKSGTVDSRSAAIILQDFMDSRPSAEGGAPS